jgi:DNA-binding HxlR family transcriptional regulator
MMKQIKENSTNQFNKLTVINKCPVSHTLGKIGGRWKPLILWSLSNAEKMRYSEIKRSIPAITEKMLIQHLKELEQDNLIVRKSLPVVPPYVEYWLSDSGKEMKPILNAMAVWGMKYVE